jgi:hypothetical protein
MRPDARAPQPAPPAGITGRRPSQRGMRYVYIILGMLSRDGAKIFSLESWDGILK